MHRSHTQEQRRSPQNERPTQVGSGESIEKLTLNRSNVEVNSGLAAHLHPPTGDFIESCRLRFLDLFAPYSNQRTYGSFSRIFISGINRPIDDRITSELKEELITRDESSSTFKLLEVGAGTPYGTNANFGSPWLARCFRSSLSSSSEVVVSDKKEKPLLDQNRIEKHLLFYLDTKGALHSFPFNAVLRAGDRALVSEFAPLAGGSHTLLPISTADLLNIAGHHLTEPSSTVDFMVRNYGPDGLFFVRPELDCDMESFLFGTEFVSNVDYYNLIASFPAQSFDFIFARHLVPLPPGTHSTVEIIESLSESIAKVLKPCGKACLHFDYPVEGEGDLLKVVSLDLSSHVLDLKYSLHWSRNGKPIHHQIKSSRL